jgi:lysozyme
MVLRHKFDSHENRNDTSQRGSTVIFNDAGLKLIREFEGCALKSYQDQRGVWTVGWGSTGKDIGPGTILTQMEADERLDQHVQEVCKEVTSLLINQSLNANQFSALVCFTYNVGSGNLQQSTLLNCVNTYHIDDAANEFEKWDKCAGIPNAGLLRRRLAEKALFLLPAD